MWEGGREVEERVWTRGLPCLWVGLERLGGKRERKREGRGGKGCCGLRTEQKEAEVQRRSGWEAFLFSIRGGRSFSHFFTPCFSLAFSLLMGEESLD